jgi:phage shock protein PspC (stress-responsive transcriptional regulator)
MLGTQCRYESPIAACYSGTDVTLVRVIVVVIGVITGGAGILAYLATYL